MKNVKNITMASVLLFACAEAFATYWTFDQTKFGTAVDWNVAAGTATTDGAWKDADGNYSKGNISEDDTLRLGDSTLTTKDSNIQLKLTLPTVTVGRIEFGGVLASNTNGRIQGESRQIIVKGDIVRLAETSAAFVYNADLRVGGSVIIFGSGNFAPDRCLRFEVGGDIIAKSAGTSNIYSITNQTVAQRQKAGTNTFENGLLSPDTVIKGIISTEVASANLSYYSKADAYDSYIQIGGVSGAGASIRREAQANAGQTANTISYFILKNTQDYSAGGATYENNGNIWTEKSGRLSLVMNGTAKQSFTNNTLQFSGGVKAMSGELSLNFNQNINSYSYFRDKDRKITVTMYDKENGTRTTFSHGNLEMLGGTFSSNDYGTFRFTNIVYSSGTIKLRLNSATQIDSIDLTSYVNRVSDATSGAAVVSWEQVAGGTITKAEGSMGPVRFDFGNNLLWLIDDQSGEFNINGGLGVKVIAWDASNKTSLSESDFAANKYSSSGDDFEAKFTIADDGLYVKYIAAIPEPASIAILFGVLAMSLAAYHRRK